MRIEKCLRRIEKGKAGQKEADLIRLEIIRLRDQARGYQLQSYGLEMRLNATLQELNQIKQGS